jgi:hypothetical protein
VRCCSNNCVRQSFGGDVRYGALYCQWAKISLTLNWEQFPKQVCIVPGYLALPLFWTLS